MTRLIIVLAVAAIASAITVKNTTQMSEQAEVKSPYHLVKAFCVVWENKEKIAADFKRITKKGKKIIADVEALTKKGKHLSEADLKALKKKVKREFALAAERTRARKAAAARRASALKVAAKKRQDQARRKRQEAAARRNRARKQA